MISDCVGLVKLIELNYQLWIYPRNCNGGGDNKLKDAQLIIV